jgi:hypothetical protein
MIFVTLQHAVQPVTPNGRQNGQSKPTPVGPSSTSTKKPNRTIKVKAEPEDVIEVPSVAKKKVSPGKKVRSFSFNLTQPSVLRVMTEGTTRTKIRRCGPNDAQCQAQG